MPRQIGKYGWIPDLHDHRDLLYAAPYTQQQLPAKMDLRDLCPPVYDQGHLGSCTANAIAAAMQLTRLKEKIAPDFIPSRLFIYYNERKMEGTIEMDCGAHLRDGLKVVSSVGCCPEEEWSYDITKFAVEPLEKCYKDAVKDMVVQYSSLSQDLSQLKGCLAEGYPFVFGFTVYDSFETETVAKTGVVNMPHATDTPLGGHAVMAVGYDDAKNCFIVRNSWGDKWGMNGYFTLPYQYLTEDGLASDFWTIRSISNN